MASAAEPLNGGVFQSDTLGYDTHIAKSIPILPSIAAPVTESGEPMDTSHHPTGSMDALALNGADGDEMNELTPTGMNEHQTVNGGASQPVGAAAAAQQPKVVQTAFIHKLYK